MRKKLPSLNICQSDYDALSRLVESVSSENAGEHDRLSVELERAKLWPDDMIPFDVVTMHSTVEFEELNTGKIRALQVTFPSDANIEKGRVSVLAPTGSALFGLRVGQEIFWPLPDGKTGRFQIKRVTQGPRTLAKIANA